MNGNNEWNLFTFIAIIDILINENLTNFYYDNNKRKKRNNV